jgi:tetratricopeptide (TPR) repeat protein
VLEQTKPASPPNPSAAPVPAVANAANKQEVIVSSAGTPLNIKHSSDKKPASFGRKVARFFTFILFLAVAAGGFYVGRRYKGPIPFIKDSGETIAPAFDPPPTIDADTAEFEMKRRVVDQRPADWLANEMKTELARQNIQSPLDSSDPRFLYLYGRASLLAANYDQASQAFEQAIAKADLNLTPQNATIRKEATLGLAAVALRSEKDKPKALTHLDELAPKPAPTSSP